MSNTERNEFYSGPRVKLVRVISTGGQEGNRTIDCIDNLGRRHHMRFTSQHNEAQLHHAQQEIDRLYAVGGNPLAWVI